MSLQRMAWLVAGVLLGCGALVQGATTRYVSRTGNSIPGYTSWADAATNIQDAVTVAGTGDLIWITNGTYTLTNQISITKAITLEGFNGSSNTFINGNYPITTNRCFTLDNAAAIISGLTISNGYAAGGDPAGNGGGILCENGLIRSCVISSNMAEFRGAGVRMTGYGTYPIMTNCTITRNGGVGVFAEGGDTKIQNCTISFNSGSGIYSSGLAENCLISNNFSASIGGGRISAGTMRNCVIVQNHAGDIGGIRVDGTGCLQDCLIMNNTSANTAGGVWIFTANAEGLRNCTVVSNSAGTQGGGLFAHADNPRVINTIIYSNTAPTGSNFYNYATTAIFSNCCTTPLPSLGANNLTNYPQFADWANNNYRLVKGSPCINTGMYQDWMTNAVDLDGHPRLNGLVDMGAYERFVNKVSLITIN